MLRPRLLVSTSVAALLSLPQLALAQPAPPPPAAPPPAAPPAAEPPPVAAEPAAAPPPAAEAPVPPPATEAAPARTEAPEATPATPPAEAAEAAVPPAEEPPPPKKLSVGKEGFFQPSALLQFWLWNQNQDEENLLSFRIRRAEMRVKGEIVPELVAYMIMIDPARALEFENRDLEVEGQDPEPTTPGTITASQPNGAATIFQDFNISFLSEYADVTLGQFKIPVSYEGFYSSSRILFPERDAVARQYGDRRDIGFKVEKKFDYFYYNVGLYNGNGQNRLDNDDQKDLGVRLEAYPIEGVTVAAVGYMGLVDRDTLNTKDRIEGDLKLEMFDAVLLAEYIHAWDGPTDGERLEGAGAYVQAGYTFLQRIQPIVRVGKLDANLNGDATDPDEGWHYEGGFNYYLRGQEARVALTASFFDYNTQPTETDVTLFAQAGF